MRLYDLRVSITLIRLSASAMLCASALRNAVSLVIAASLKLVVSLNDLVMFMPPACVTSPCRFSSMLMLSLNALVTPGNVAITSPDSLTVSTFERFDALSFATDSPMLVF